MSAKRLTDNQAYVLGWLDEFGPRTINEMLRCYGVGWYSSKLYAVLQQLERKGLVTYAKGERSSLWWSLGASREPVAR